MELEILRTIQKFHNPFFDTFFELITILGEEIFLVPILAMVYWTLNKKLGEKIGYIVLTSVTLNSVLKGFFNLDRPIGKEGIRTLRPETATGQSFPSGHSQGSATAAATISYYLKNKGVTIFSIILVSLIGFSRLYLGVHYPKDVIVGILVGLLVTYIGVKLLEKFDALAVYWLTLLAFLPLLIFDQSGNFIKSMGGFAGFVLGITLEKKFVNFTIDISWLKKGIRIGVGLIFIVLIRSGLKMIFPQIMIFDFIRYTLLTFFAIGLYPWIFTKLKI